MIKSIFDKATVQGILAGMIGGMACYLGFTGAIDGPSFLGLTLLVAGFYFGKGGGTDAPEK